MGSAGRQVLATRVQETASSFAQLLVLFRSGHGDTEQLLHHPRLDWLVDGTGSPEDGGQLFVSGGGRDSNRARKSAALRQCSRASMTSSSFRPARFAGVEREVGGLGMPREASVLRMATCRSRARPSAQPSIRPCARPFLAPLCAPFLAPLCAPLPPGAGAATACRQGRCRRVRPTPGRRVRAPGWCLGMAVTRSWRRGSPPRSSPGRSCWRRLSGSGRRRAGGWSARVRGRTDGWETSDRGRPPIPRGIPTLRRGPACRAARRWCDSTSTTTFGRSCSPITRP